MICFDMEVADHVLSDRFMWERYRAGDVPGGLPLIFRFSLPAQYHYLQKLGLTLT